MEAILDFNQDLDVGLFDRVVDALFSGKGEEQKMAQQVLTQFTDHEMSWARADRILSDSNSLQSKFIALQILEKLIQTKWKILDEEPRNGIKNFSLNLIVELASSEESLRQNRVFLSKLNLVLVQILKQDWPQKWPDFIPDIVATSRTNLALCENNMAILKLLSEEVFDFSAEQMTQAKAKALKTQMCGEFSSIYSLCMEILQKAVQPSLILATLETLLRFLSWIPFGFIFEMDLINNLCTRFLQPPITRNVTIKCLTEIGSLECGNEYQEQLVNMFTMAVGGLHEILGDLGNVSEEWDEYDDDQQEFIQNVAIFLTSFLSSHLRLVETSASRASVIQAHQYVLRISQVDERELFKVCLEYWNVLVRGMYEDSRTSSFNAPSGLLNLGSNAGANGASMSADLRRQMYSGILTGVRYVMISRMARPEEVLIVENDEGEIVREFIKETDTITLYKAERECLIYLTHLDPKDMENIMVEKLNRQMDGSEWSWSNLNKLCWAIGSISGSMSEDQERRVLVIIIKDLLSLCELKRGKDNKAVVASNIMYVVGQYPRFLKAHWKFLKTVANKLFEFMHELHEGVRDMACDTFVTIAQKCRRHFIAHQPGEASPFVDEIIANAESITSDLMPQQVNRFCEAVGYLISAQLNTQTQAMLISGLMKPYNDEWNSLVQKVGENINVLEDLNVVKQLGNILRVNVSACGAVGKGFISQVGNIYIDMLGLYKAVSEIISSCVARDGAIATKYANVRAMRTIKKEALRLVDTYVKHCDGEVAAVNENMVPPLLEAVLADYAQNVPPARDAEVLKTVNTITGALGGLMTDKIPIVFDSLFESTINMINQDFTDYPEHRLAIYQLLQTINQKCFSALLNLPPQQFRFMVMSIMWGFKHTHRDVADVALTITQDMINNFNMCDRSISDAFFKAYFVELLNEIIVVLADNEHKSSFKPQYMVLARMVRLIDSNQITAPLFDASQPENSGLDNGMYVRQSIANLLATAFANLTQRQIEVFVEGLFNYNDDLEKFRNHVRDFLIQTKEFAGDNADLYLDETEHDIEQKKQKEKEMARAIPGMVKPSEMEEDE
ncbi:Karyopherin transporter [Coemansia sp. RSA 2523]|nr:Karyopherin transporter [Coemansia sp. RSA 1591]KAJ1764500.1 Karyopherin transporter [Coemansia sp. RSA 1752]KAJ1778357.1 Karyopherin transporter [Coemansia sp. RSA 1824]KAJ1791627.1 Karyopherin transporter [Coemansia sp. RSA 1938]KAJ1808565.1 Karyopherin transporter [Coemansia sp. RSA 2523]KAJ2146658.1 Karyopherin transporter [Coemansia sp. RSA 564]KAJ2168370.1 Karyopherin transporter [Coemansia sp. RSA 562]KAJ2277564.1 Karyopherin transporter [Coemansia sp. RSA 451]KAJ2292638.1 Karyoph